MQELTKKVIARGPIIRVKDFVQAYNKYEGYWNEYGCVNPIQVSAKNDKCVPMWSIYVNSKGNLILDKNEIRLYLPQELYDKVLYGLKEKYCTRPVMADLRRSALALDDNAADNDAAVENSAIEDLNKDAPKYDWDRINVDLTFLRYNPFPEEASNLNISGYRLATYRRMDWFQDGPRKAVTASAYIRNQKIIITPDAKIYFSNGRRIRRVSKESLIGNRKPIREDKKVMFGDYIVKSILHPNRFFNCNNFTGTAYSDYCRVMSARYNKHLDYVMNSMGAGNRTDFIHPEQPDFVGTPRSKLGSDFFTEVGDNEYDRTYATLSPNGEVNISKWQLLAEQKDLEEYFNVLKSYCPLLYYTHARIRGKYNSVIGHNVLPKWLKKTFVEPENFGCRENPNLHTMLMFKLANNLGLKDVNIIKKFIAYRPYKDVPGVPFNPKNIKMYYQELKKAYKNDNMKNLESLLYSRICVDKDNYKVDDALGMLCEAIKRRKEHPNVKLKPLDMQYLMKHSLKDVHDTLSIIARDDIATLKYAPFEFKAHNSIDLYVKQFKGYTFDMPRDTNQLTRLSEVMRNCVASYKTSIMNGTSIIVYATDNEEVLNYIRNGEGDIKELTRKLESDEILSPACIEIQEADPSDIYREEIKEAFERYKAYYRTADPLRDPLNDNIDNPNEMMWPIIVRQCYARHNKHMDDKNPKLDKVCDKYFHSMNMATFDKRYNF